MVGNSVRCRNDLLELQRALLRNDFLIMKAHHLSNFFGNPVSHQLPLQIFQLDVVGFRHGFVDVENAAVTIFDQSICRNVVHKGLISWFGMLFLFLGKLQGSQHSVDRLAQIGNLVMAFTMDTGRRISTICDASHTVV